MDISTSTMSKSNINIFIRIMIAFALMVTAVFPVGAQEKFYVLTSPEITVDMQTDIIYKTSITEATGDTIRLDLTYWLGWRNSRLFLGSDTVVIDQSSKQRTFIHGIFQTDTIVLDIWVQRQPYAYKAAYMRNRKNRISVNVPEVYELANILLFIADTARVSVALKASVNDYAFRVAEKFASWKGHPAARFIQNNFKKDAQVNFRENSAAYKFSNDKIMLSEMYQGFRARDQFAKLLGMVEDFAKQSDFLSFYKTEQSYYGQLVNNLEEQSEAGKSWKWLEQRFDSPHQSLKIITSPLSSSWHSTRCYQQDSFREIIIFISAPEGITQSGNHVPVMRRLFTELDHHYVNPVSERFKKSIETAIGDRLPHWNAGGSYGSPLLTFNEYMTWALFGIYLFDQIGDQSAIEMKPSIAFMEKDRGFKLFRQFYSELLSLYQRHPVDDLTNLYPPMIDWMGQQTAD